MGPSLGTPGATEERHDMSLSTYDVSDSSTADQARNPRTIIVGYDGSDEARAAFAVAIDRSRPTDTLVVVHATAPAWNWLGTPYYERAVAENHAAAERVLDEMRPIAGQIETHVEFEVLEGPPAEVLARMAESRDAAEIVVGSRGLGRIRGALGSVSQQLLRDAVRPVLVVSRDAAATVEAPALLAW